MSNGKTFFGNKSLDSNFHNETDNQHNRMSGYTP